ncbi:ATP-dependent RecD-like DNA helicase [Roseomonas sp. HF4]|uniref:ATP-dependent DNA helicase n=1 Tax=Roseomonas sp. HF4 TaxID=2562313 RepID=UPI0010C0C16F|nr:DEAD/DEAH box helicase [Roseomonas sp. HF4]
MSFTPSPQQADAIRAIVDWFQNRTHQQQVFRLFGYAGSGKSTVITYAMQAIGIDVAASGDEEDAAPRRILFAAFTGKAALVMTRKGTPASTIHSLIYRVSEATPEEIDRVERDLLDLQRGLGRMAPAERAFAEIQISKLQLRLADIHKPTFLLNEQSLVRDADLIVLDEVSMVGPEMAADLLAFGKPILVLGDPGQLPPIKGTGAFTEAKPDIMLTEIHRQAGESAIIRLATMARQGIDIPPGEHDAHVWKLPRNAVRPEQMLRGGQVICGRNDTRRWLNSQIKQAAGFPAPYPAGQDEKLICLKNRHDLSLVNGMFLSLAEIRHESDLAFSATITTEDGVAISGRHRFYKGHYDDHVRYDRERLTRDYREMRGLIESSWGYAITCHKAQGSQWENVVVYDDGLSRTAEDRNRWLYTAITRAERGLVILD